MPCFSPLKGYYSKALTVNGKRSFVSDRGKSNDEKLEIPCGKCIGCKLERSRVWAMRCVHESQLHEKNCFITLTYASEHLPPGGTLVVRDYQLFMKRLRKKFGKKIRFFQCGEYGEKLGRPHYHALLFNFDFPDKKFWRGQGQSKLYTSEILQELWPYGHCSIGDATFESAAYVARYCTKKITGPSAAAHYSGKKPEYTTMSRRPGIGLGWLQKFGATDVFAHDFVIVRGQKVKVPRYYEKIYEVTHPEKYQQLREKRAYKNLELSNRGVYVPNAQAQRMKLDSTDERLKVKEIVQLRTMEQLKRNIEKE